MPVMELIEHATEWQVRIAGDDTVRCIKVLHQVVGPHGKRSRGAYFRVRRSAEGEAALRRRLPGFADWLDVARAHGDLCPQVTDVG
jgi:hypothetical protein